MKVRISRGRKNLKTVKFSNDDLFQFYDFETGELGDKIIAESTVSRVMDSDMTLDVSDVELILELAEECQVDERAQDNFVLRNENGRISFKIGYYMGKIKKDIDIYKKFLNALKEAREYKIEFI